jgi:hypothetical protein
VFESRLSPLFASRFGAFYRPYGFDSPIDPHTLMITASDLKASMPRDPTP